jgi:hypothetical protein
LAENTPLIVSPLARAAVFLIAAWLFAFGQPAIAAERVAARSVDVEKTAFRVTLSDGRVLAQEQLRGAILVLGDGSGAQRRVRIDGVERDSKDPAGEIILYALSEHDSQSGEWHNLCLPDIGPPSRLSAAGCLHIRWTL